MEFQNHTAILHLPNPPEPEWYLKKIAGLPFFLRNLLTLEKLGIKKLVIWAEEPIATNLKAYLDKINLDAELELNWACENSFPPETSSLLILDGSTLFDQDETKSKIVEGNGNNFLSPSEPPKFLTNQHRVHFWQLINSKQPEKLLTKKDFKEAEDKLLKSCGLNNDSFMDRLLTRSISRQLTGVFIKTSLTPNQITILSMLVGLVAAFCFYLGSYQMGIAGATLLLVSAWIDCTDGEIARLKFMVSEWGGKLDLVADNIVHCFVFYSIGMGLLSSTGDPVYKYLGIVAVLGSLVSFILLSETILWKKSEASKGSLSKPSKKNFTDQLANRDFTYLLFALALFGRLDAFIFLTALGSNFLAAYLLFQKFQTNSD